MKNQKRLRVMSTCLLALVVVVSLVLLAPTKAQAATSGYYTYTVSGGTATITDYSGSATKLTIPSTLGGYPVTSIGDSAFSDCASLTRVTIGASVTSIGDSAFSWCDSLTVIWVDENNANYSSDNRGVLFNKDKTTLVQAPGGISGSYTIPDSVTSIGNAAFRSCKRLTSVTIPDSVTSIGDYAFYYCDSLTSVTIGDSVTSIGSSAFQYCYSLTSVTIPDSVESIGNYAFYSCEMTSVTIGDSVKSIGSYAFYYCDSLTSVTIPDSVTSIGNDAFAYCNRLTSVTIGDSVTSIGSSAFQNCYSLTSVTIPDSVTSIGHYAFYSCYRLTGVTIPDSVQSIGNAAFFYCRALTGVTIPDSVTSIGSSAFEDCASLTSVTIPDSVESIGNYAFSDCASLTSVTIGDSVTSIGDYAFACCYSLTDVYYAGTQSQWNGISIGSHNDDLTSATIHYQHIHDYTLFPSVTVEPTCTQNGYTEYTCVWGDTDRQMIPALGHDYTVFVNTVAPTCLDGGYSVYRCVRCEKTQTRDQVPALGHNYTVYVETVAPTCLDGGYSVYRCVRCEETQTRDQVPALGHDYTVHVETVAPTCLDGGYSVYRCVRCEETQTRDQVSALGHDYSGTVTLVEPTCKDQGYTGTQCIRCDSIQKTNITNVVTHKLVILPAVDPTCTEPGLTLGTTCKWCGLVGVAQKEVAALGGNCDYTADPTICSNCGYVRADVDITNVVLRPTCSGLYFKGSFTFGAHETVSRYGIAVSLYNDLPVADGSDETSLYTVGENSVLISNILDSSNGKTLIYARPYVLLADGTYIYGDVVCTNLKSVVETIDTKWETLTTAQKTAIADMYLQHTAAMQNWLIPKIKEFGEA